MSVFALVVAAIVGASPGPGEPPEEKWRLCIDGADEARIAGCEDIVGDTEFTRNARAFAAATIGDIYLAQLRPAAAAGEFSRAIRLAPDYGYPYRRRGFANFLIGRSDEALADYDSAIELSPLDPYAHVSRGSFFRQTGELDRARADIEKALELDLENSDLYYERGLLSLDVRDYQQAELDFTKSLLLKPDEHDARYNLVNALRFQLRTEEALEQIDIYVGEKPEDPQGYRMRGWLRVDTGNVAGAQADFETALSLSPDDLSLHYALGFVYGRLGDYQLALDLYRIAEPEYRGESYFYYERGYAHYMLDHDRLALNDANRSLELKPDDVDALWLKGAALLYLEDYPEAIAALNMVLQRDPDNVDALVMRARVQIASEHFYPAIGDLTRALELEPDNYPAQAYRGYAAGLAGHAERGRTILDEVIASRPDAALAYELAARLLYGNGEHLEASDYSGRLVELVPSNASYQVLHADIILELERYDEAYDVYLAAIRSTAEPPASWLRLGAYSAFRADDKANALALLERARKVDPDDVWTNALVADLWLERSEFEMAAEAYELAIAGSEDADNLFAYRFGKAQADAGAGRHLEALKLLDILAKQKPDDMDVSWARANALMELGRRADALVEFEHFRAAKPASLEVHYKLIAIMIDETRFDEALALADRVVDLEPGGVVDGYRARARVHLARGDFDAADRDLAEAISRAADDAELHAMRAKVRLETGTAYEAIQSARRAMQLEPHSLEYRLLLARSLIRDNSPKAALSVLHAALEEAEGADEPALVAEAHRLKALAHQALGDVEAAGAAMKRAEGIGDQAPRAIVLHKTPGE